MGRSALGKGRLPCRAGTNRSGLCRPHRPVLTQACERPPAPRVQRDTQGTVTRGVVCGHLHRDSVSCRSAEIEVSREGTPVCYTPFSPPCAWCGHWHTLGLHDLRG